MPETDLTRDPVAPQERPRPEARPSARKLPSRLEVAYPRWIDTAMRTRWVWLVAGGLFAGYLHEVSGRAWTVYAVWFGAIALHISTPSIAYRIYRRENPIEAEIVFYNEKDGYCHSDGDDDGDGDGD